MRNTFAVAIGFIISSVFALTGCIDDGVSSNPADLPEWSADTLRLGEMWAGEVSPTTMLTLRNSSSKSVVIDRISVASCAGGELHLNVDGLSGDDFSGVEIRGNDSVYVLVEALPDGGALSGAIEVEMNGAVSRVPVAGNGLVADCLEEFRVEGDMLIPEDAVIRVFGCLSVAEDAVLTIGAGATLYFHDGASLRVDGTLLAGGEPQRAVTMRGDRLADVISGIPFDVMAGQWEGITFSEGSKGNRLECADISNTCSGVTADDGSEVAFDNCRLSNSQAYALEAKGSAVSAVGCEFSNAASGLMRFDGCRAELSRCTLSNHYLFAFPSGAAIILAGDSEIEVAESIVHGDGKELDASSSSRYRFTACLFGSNGSDDADFNSCIWNADPQFCLDLDNYLMDFRLGAQSPARGKASTVRTDRYGVAGNAIGAYN